MKRKIFTTVSILTAAIICCTGCMSKEAKSAQKKIDSLPDSYYDGILPALEDASKSYEELSDEDKDQVKNNAVDSLYEQYYKSIADEINQKTNDFQISGKTKRRPGHSTPMKGRLNPGRLAVLWMP